MEQSYNYFVSLIDKKRVFQTEHEKEEVFPLSTKLEQNYLLDPFYQIIKLFYMDFSHIFQYPLTYDFSYSISILE